MNYSANATVIAVIIHKYKCTNHLFKVVREDVSWYGRYLIIVHFINTGPTLENAYPSYFDHHICNAHIYIALLKKRPK